MTVQVREDFGASTIELENGGEIWVSRVGDSIEIGVDEGYPTYDIAYVRLTLDELTAFLEAAVKKTLKENP
ncbi:hypothetical protein CUCO_56 [Mycobacterium phage Cuco]|uniref:Uncharacterized protein n=1 Tax=Mycobacterium phage Cuco TaxID=2922992 RepID=G1JUN1_9CAUD|nr:hypothetical protein FGG35_gp37 [Mycobacterium phage Cuco]AEL17708.1 hypothetical protein CUCO_56 [Mycobacterium phage Cuco]AVR76640.1 hypothetical protein SEA_COOG_55 [Mycobacterium phage Coog]AVR77185.1 hypothetical protein SEA_MIDAS2_55 [Mycobacterium phage Midas2]